MTTRLENLKVHFGLTKTPSDIGDNYQAFLDFLDWVITSKDAMANAVINEFHSQFDSTGLSANQIAGAYIDWLIVNHWGEAETAQGVA